MSNDQDKLIQDEAYTLEDILAEYAAVPPREQAGPVFVDPPSSPVEDEGTSEEPAASEEEEPDLPWQEAPRRPRSVVRFPTEEDVPPSEPEDEEPEDEEPEDDDASPLEHLKRRADAFADRMFSEEGVEVSERTVRAEELIPGVDEEEPAEEEVPSRRERRPRKKPAPPPDLPPAELARSYAKGLGSLRLRWFVLCLLFVGQLYLLLQPVFGLPDPAQLSGIEQLPLWLSGGLLLPAAALSADVWWRGLVRLFGGKPGMDTLLACSTLFTLADAASLIAGVLPDRAGQLPYAAAVTLAQTCALRGCYLKKMGLRTACRTAAAAQQPYVVTLDPARWNNRPAYSKHADAIAGFGSQIQSDDGAQRLFRPVCGLLLVACTALSLLSSVGQGRGEYLLWCLSATFTASSALGGLLCYARPFFTLSRRLARSGAVLAGWDGVESLGKSVLLTDGDLFPPGTVAVNGIKVFGDISLEKVTALCATLLHDAGSGLDRIFRDLLRAQGGSYRNAAELTCYEAGGLSAVIRDQQVLVGTAAFMSLMEVRLPQGLNVKNAVFCAIDGELAGIFALNYTLHSAISPALDALIRNRITPVLVTRDFNIIPAMLRQRFKLPVEKMEYPNMERRMELSDPEQVHAEVLTAVLCREGLAPLSEAVVGGLRLRRAVRLSGAFLCVGSALGALLSYYLTVQLAFTSLSPLNLLIFLVMWLVPTCLIGGWVDQY